MCTATVANLFWMLYTMNRRHVLHAKFWKSHLISRLLHHLAARTALAASRGACRILLENRDPKILDLIGRRLYIDLALFWPQCDPSVFALILVGTSDRTVLLGYCYPEGH